MSKNDLLLHHPLRLVVHVSTTISAWPLRDGNLWQADVLHDRPDNGQATGFRRKGVNLIGALPHIAKETFNGIARLNMSVHGGKERLKGQDRIFILSLRIASG